MLIDFAGGFMKIGICDDTTEYRRVVRSFVDDYIDKHYLDCTVYEYKNGTDLLNCDINHDILFLDIELGDINGIEVAKQLQNNQRHTVLLIVTSHHCYLDDAFDLNVTRFIDKPVSEARIFSALDKAVSIINEEVLTLHTRNSVLRLKASEIVYAEAKLKSLYIFTQDSSYKVKETMA